jgi:hypothetical protein
MSSDKSFFSFIGFCLIAVIVAVLWSGHLRYESNLKDHHKEIQAAMEIAFTQRAGELRQFDGKEFEVSADGVTWFIYPDHVPKGLRWNSFRVHTHYISVSVTHSVP